MSANLAFRPRTKTAAHERHRSKTPEEIENARRGRLGRRSPSTTSPFVKPGVTTGELDKLCHDYMVDVQGCVPAPLNYARPATPYPKSICTSVNHQVCHGVPGEKVLKEGRHRQHRHHRHQDGYHGDTSRMFIVGGDLASGQKRLCQITYECMWLGIAQVKPGAHLGDIGHAIQKHAEGNGFRWCVSSAATASAPISRRSPGAPLRQAGTGIELKPGMIFTIEPMINAGKAAISELPDGWTIVTRTAACRPSGSTWCRRHRNRRRSADPCPPAPAPPDIVARSCQTCPRPPCPTVPPRTPPRNRTRCRRA